MRSLRIQHSNNRSFIGAEGAEKTDAIANNLELQFSKNPVIHLGTEREVNETVRRFLRTPYE